MPARRTPQRLIALVAAAAALFNYPFLFLADGHGTVLGIPSLYLYLFGCWAALIVCAALLVDRAAHTPRAPAARAEGSRDA